MSKLVITKADGEVVEFEDVIGHQIGNGAVQVMMKDGTQYIYNNFIDVFVDLDAEDKKAFQKRIGDAEKEAERQFDEAEKVKALENKDLTDNVIALDS